MRKPPKGQLWLHVERLDAEDGKVWAIQGWEGRKRFYRTAAGVVIQGPSYTAFFGTTGKQPKAVIVVPEGCCEVAGAIAVITPGRVDG
jgi:hypothetical protein